MTRRLYIRTASACAVLLCIATWAGTPPATGSQRDAIEVRVDASRASFGSAEPVVVVLTVHNASDAALQVYDVHIMGGRHHAFRWELRTADGRRYGPAAPAMATDAFKMPNPITLQSGEDYRVTLVIHPSQLHVLNPPAGDADTGTKPRLRPLAPPADTPAPDPPQRGDSAMGSTGVTPSTPLPAEPITLWLMPIFTQPPAGGPRLPVRQVEEGAEPVEPAPYFLGALPAIELPIDRREADYVADSKRAADAADVVVADRTKVKREVVADGVIRVTAPVTHVLKGELRTGETVTYRQVIDRRQARHMDYSGILYLRRAADGQLELIQE